LRTVELLAPEPSPFEVEIAIRKLESYKSSGIEQTLEELIQAGGTKICSEIPKLISFIWNKEVLPQQWKESVVVTVYKMEIKVTVVFIEECQCN
jgi:hypothetical protein